MSPAPTFLAILLTCDSRQIRPPIYSIKQSRLRKRRVIRFAVLYFVLLISFILLFFGPIIVANFVDLSSLGKSIPLDLMQPIGQDNNDTFASITGSALVNFGDGSGAAATSAAGGGGGGGGGGSGSAATTSAAGPFDFNSGSTKTKRAAVRWVTIA